MSVSITNPGILKDDINLPILYFRLFVSTLSLDNIKMYEKNLNEKLINKINETDHVMAIVTNGVLCVQKEVSPSNASQARDSRSSSFFVYTTCTFLFKMVFSKANQPLRCCIKVQSKTIAHQTIFP